jgi:transposase-like protein
MSEVDDLYLAEDGLGLAAALRGGRVSASGLLEAALARAIIYLTQRSIAITLIGMTNTAPEPQTLIEAIRYFADPDIALCTMIELRWPKGVHCPTCGRTDPRFIATRRIWECKEKHSRRQFSAKVGTIFEDSPIDLGKWFAAIWMVTNCKNGISSYEMHRALGVTQKTAWFMDHRIRLAMKTGTFIKMSGEVEADETYIDGLAKNMHEHKRAQKIKGTGGAGKEAVLGIIERSTETTTSRIKASHVRNVRGVTLKPEVRANVEPGSTVYTDALKSYLGLGDTYDHQTVDHAIEFVRDRVHTNSVENFWSLLKRTIKGTYVSVDPVHLEAYLDEQAFRFNERKHNDGVRFRKVTASVAGRRLTYAELIGKHGATPKPN